MMRKQIIFDVYDEDDIDNIPIEPDKWKFALIKLKDSGKIVLAEVSYLYLPTKEGGSAVGWCLADSDFIDEKEFDKWDKDEDWYQGQSFEEHRSWMLSDLIHSEEYEDEDIDDAEEEEK